MATMLDRNDRAFTRKKNVAARSVLRDEAAPCRAMRLLHLPENGRFAMTLIFIKHSCESRAYQPIRVAHKSQDLLVPGKYDTCPSTVANSA
jgi:hypothetical protein